MRYLIDKQTEDVKRKLLQHPDLVCGQLATPLTNYRWWGGQFAVDNGAYSGLDRTAFFRLLSKHEPNMPHCLFVAVPDVVGNARRTTELYFQITQQKELWPWTKLWSMVMQDGHEDVWIDWNAVRHLFIGGTDRFKDSSAAYDIVKTAKALGIPVHVGRVNTPKRFIRYRELGCDTCDGSGVAKYDWMLDRIAAEIRNSEEPTLFDGETGDNAHDDHSCEMSDQQRVGLLHAHDQDQ